MHAVMMTCEYPCVLSADVHKRRNWRASRCAVCGRTTRTPPSHAHISRAVHRRKRGLLVTVVMCEQLCATAGAESSTC